jgi:subtilisin family serine protease
MSKFALFLLAVATMLLSSFQVSHSAETRGSLVRLRPTQETPLSSLMFQHFLISNGAKSLATDSGLYVVAADVDTISGNFMIESAVPNYVRHIFKMDETAKLPVAGPPPSAWGIEKIGALQLWANGIKGSQNIVVAVIDTGFEYTHPEIKGNVWTAADGSHGYNAIKGTLDPMDDNSHGTHCSGTIGGKSVGVNKKVSIMGVKFLSAEGSGDDAGAIDSINWAASHGAHVMSASWGGGPANPELEGAIKNAGDKGILFVAAAGNEMNDNDKTPSYPASIKLDNVISVAATAKNDSMAYFSNYGATTVHVAAPGVGIYSSVLNGKYDSYSGTSMATPHVSGVVALMLSQGIKSQDIKSLLIKTSMPFLGLRDKVVAGGRMDAFAAVTGK